MLLRLSVGLIFSLLAINPLHAETFGTQEEVVQAAKDGKEPAYIKELMQALSKKLAVIAKNRGESDHSKDLAWLFSMRNVVILDNVAYNAANHAAGRWAQDAVLDFSSNTAWCAAWNAAIGAASNPIPHSSVGEAADKAASTAVKAAYNAAYQHAYKAAKEAADQAASLEESARLAYRAAEWATLNWLFENIESVANQVYSASLGVLSKLPKTYPFENKEQMTFFMKSQFGWLNSEAMIFLAPWLVHIVPLDTVPANHQPLFKELLGLSN